MFTSDLDLLYQGVSCVANQFLSTRLSVHAITPLWLPVHELTLEYEVEWES